MMEQPSILDPWKLGMFLGYCGCGVVTISYYTYKSIKMKNDDGVKYLRNKKITQSPQFRQYVIKGTGLTLAFALGLGYMLKMVKPADIFFKEAVIRSEKYNEKIRGDKAYQDYYIMDTMKYFGVSKEWVEQVEEELKKMEVKEVETTLERQLLKMALQKEKLIRQL